jgi:hypothetical protein
VYKEEFEGGEEFTLFLARDAGDTDITTVLCSQTSCWENDSDTRTIPVLSSSQWEGVIRDRMTSMLGFIAALITIGLFGVNQLWKVVFGKNA